MKIGITGYRNHARQLIDSMSRRPEIRSMLVYHPDRNRVLQAKLSDLSDKISAANDFEELKSCDAVVISSPNNTHVEFIKQLIHEVPYVLCEKPPAISGEEIAWLRRLPATERRRLRFNFNYSRTPFVQHVRDCVNDSRLGMLVHGSFAAAHGLAFRKEYSGNWRLNDQDPFSTILGNLGIHYIHLILDIFGDCQRHFLQSRSFSGARNQVDSVTLAMHLEGGRSAEIFLSYATPYINSSRVIFTNGVVDLNDGVVTERTPRDTFDAHGRFALPPEMEIHRSLSSRDYYAASIDLVIDEFIASLAGNWPYEERAFELALRSAELILEIRETVS